MNEDLVLIKFHPDKWGEQLKWIEDNIPRERIVDYTDWPCWYLSHGDVRMHLQPQDALWFALRWG